MPLDPSHWEVLQPSKDIRYIGPAHGAAGAGYVTVLELHRWLQDLADDSSFSGDDQISIVHEDPSDRSTNNIVSLINGYNIDDTAAEHIYNGSIIQDGGNTIYDGIKNFGPAGIKIQIIQNGSIIAPDWWNTGGGLNADPSNGVSHNFMIKVRSGGADIDGRRLVGITRELGKTYKEFVINGTERGINVLALDNTIDLNNQTPEATLAAIADISNVEGYQLIDVDNDGIGEPYYSQWDRGGNSINTLYEYTKWLTRDGSSSTIYGLSGEIFRGITHEIPLSGGVGTWTEPEQVSWPGGTGQLLAVNDTDAPTSTKMWIQLLTGTAPAPGDTLTGTTSGATATSGAPIAKTVSSTFIGLSTGSSIIGAFGIGIEAADLTANDKLTDLNDNLVTPPNLVTFEVKGLVAGEDYVLVAPWDGFSADLEGNPKIHYNQFSLQTAMTGAAETSVQINTNIPTDTPSSGHIRIKTASGAYKKVSYTSWSGDTFTIPATDFSSDNAAAGNDVFISYVDTLASSSVESFQSVYVADRDLVVIDRDGGPTPIKQFITSAELTANGGSVTVIRTSDA